MVAIVYGRMRMYCAKDGNGVVGLGKVRKWPQCRDPAITHCENAPGKLEQECNGPVDLRRQSIKSPHYLH